MSKFMFLAALALAATSAYPNAVKAQGRDRCNDFANEMSSLDQRAQQLQCRPWTKRRIAYEVNYNWCQSSPPASVESATNKWRSEFQRCQFQASGAPAAQPARPALQAATGLGCPRPGTVRSQNSHQQTQIQFVNNSFQPVKIYWLDFQGQRKFYRELKHGQSYMQRTFLTHPWIVVDPNGTCFAPYQAATVGVNRMEIR